MAMLNNSMVAGDLRVTGKLYGELNGNSSTSSYPAGFAGRNTSASWGTHTGGTLVTDWTDGAGGDIAFWKNYPASGQLSVLIDGYCVQKEGQYRCLDTSDINSAFYAPTSAGTNGYLLKSNGSGAPTWAHPNDLTVGSASKVLQKLDDNTATGEYYVLHSGTQSLTTSGVSSDVYGRTGVSIQPSSGRISAITYRVNSACTMQYNSTTQSLDFVF